MPAGSGVHTTRGSKPAPIRRRQRAWSETFAPVIVRGRYPEATTKMTRRRLRPFAADAAFGQDVRDGGKGGSGGGRTVAANLLYCIRLPVTTASEGDCRRTHLPLCHSVCRENAARGAHETRIGDDRPAHAAGDGRSRTPLRDPQALGSAG